ncbi:MAG: YggS family pyridoxal phosphate-dependent enzyme [Phycisphaerae bacterium]|nr:YggS family pyridoxal phosphate-dependent enzyme [Phycisphaerae bacterium]
MSKTKLADNLKRVRDRIAAAAVRAKRKPESVRLVCVTKGRPDAAVAAAIELGQIDLGESRVQDLQTRVAKLSEYLTRRTSGLQLSLQWHMIGHLQRNKVKPLLPMVHMIHSVDTLRLAESVDQAAGKGGRKMPLLLEVNCSEEPQKFGVAVGAVECLVEQVATLPNVELRGLMTMAPHADRAEDSRTCFARLREVFEDVVRAGRAGPGFRDLSMGMSQDFEVGIEEGATIVRIGTAIFEGV